MNSSPAECQLEHRRRLRKHVRIVAILFGLPLVALLLPVLLMLLGVLPTSAAYSYISSDGKFDDFEMPSKGRTLRMVELLFDDYRKQVGRPDLTLYRTTARVWWHSWEWPDYASNPPPA
ncbi:MAG TPA: hypothetical protein VFY71_13150 [Planctomycetota bacterium]|nr:hypothetical protein [Planctomycetota bacterium]